MNNIIIVLIELIEVYTLDYFLSQIVTIVDL